MTEGVLESRTWNIQHVSRYHKSKEITSYFPKLFLVNNERIFYLLKTKQKLKEDLTSYTVAMLTCFVKIMIITCSTSLNFFIDSTHCCHQPIMVEVVIHQNTSAVNCYKPNARDK